MRHKAVAVGGSLGAAFLPSDLSDLHRWFDASDSSTITVTGQGVSEWRDKSGNIAHLGQNNDGDRPATGVTTQNGLNVIGFTDDTSNLIGSTGAADWRFWHETANTTFIVFKDGTSATPNSVTTLLETNGASQTNTGRYLILDHRNATPALGKLRDLVTTGLVVTSADNFLPPNTWQSYHCVYDPTFENTNFRHAAFRDNTAKLNSTTGTGTPPASSPQNALRVAGSGGVGDYWVAEIIIYNRVLNLDEQYQIANYLATKWGLTAAATPDYYTAPDTIAYSADYDHIKIPSNITTITVDAYGAEGGPEISGTTLTGDGGRVQCDLTVVPNEILRAFVGGAGAVGVAGFNGGGTATASQGGGGGGATDIRRFPYGLADRLVVAPGGGGAGYNNGQITTGGGGAGHTPTGATGQNGIGGPTAGTGGTSSAGGSGGSSGGANGSLGRGGNGSSSARGGGGGGAGYYGGGGGGGGAAGTAGGGGGGGSGLSTGVNETLQSGVQTGNGQIIVSW